MRTFSDLKLQVEKWVQVVPQEIQNRLSPTAKLQLFSLLQIPLLFSVRPRVLSSTELQCIVEVGLNRFTKNHSGSMYFGALSIGADAVVAIHALSIAERLGLKNVAPVFKSFKAQFVRRADTNVHFICDDGGVIRQILNEAVATKERVTRVVKARAVSAKDHAVLFAELDLEPSLKIK